jgi:predicted phosphoribosyltransferase
VILVDDGLATGSTMRAAIAALRKMDPASVVVAIPTAPSETVDEIKGLADEVICLETPEPFYAIALSYEQFPQVSDEQVRRLLQQAGASLSSAAAAEM